MTTSEGTVHRFGGTAVLSGSSVPLAPVTSKNLDVMESPAGLSICPTASVKNGVKGVRPLMGLGKAHVLIIDKVVESVQLEPTTQNQ